MFPCITDNAVGRLESRQLDGKAASPVPGKFEGNAALAEPQQLNGKAASLVPGKLEGNATLPEPGQFDEKAASSGLLELKVLGALCLAFFAGMKTSSPSPIVKLFSLKHCTYSLALLD